MREEVGADVPCALQPRGKSAVDIEHAEYFDGLFVALGIGAFHSVDPAAEGVLGEVVHLTARDELLLRRRLHRGATTTGCSLISCRLRCVHRYTILHLGL